MNREYPDRPVASAAAVVLRGDQVLLIKRGFAPRKGIWTFPGGAIEAGETAREACAREVLEEAGIHISVGPVVDAVDILQPEGDRWKRHYVVMDFLAVPLDDAEPLCAGSDACDAVWAAMGSIADYDLAPLATHVLNRAQWMYAKGSGPLMPDGAKTIIEQD